MQILLSFLISVGLMLLLNNIRIISESEIVGSINSILVIGFFAKSMAHSWKIFVGFLSVEICLTAIAVLTAYQYFIPEGIIAIFIVVLIFIPMFVGASLAASR